MPRFKTVPAAFMLVLSGAVAGYAQQNTLVDPDPLYRTIVALPGTLTGGTEKVLELYRTENGVVDDMRIMDATVSNVAHAGCVGCIYHPEIGCIPVGCGGGTLSTGGAVFVQVAPGGEGSGNGLTLRATNIFTEQTAVIEVPDMASAGAIDNANE